MTISLSTVQRAPQALAGAAGDLQDLAFIGFFQIAARFDRPATVLFDTVERVEAGAYGAVDVARRLLKINGSRETDVARVASG